MKLRSFFIFLLLLKRVISNLFGFQVKKLEREKRLGDIVDKTCKQTPDYSLCLSLLRSDPRSSSADTVGLGLILVDKIKVSLLHELIFDIR